MAVAAAQKSREMFAVNKSYSIENGYGARRRSLVDDARFESIVVKQTKQTVLEEARQRANDIIAAENTALSSTPIINIRLPQKQVNDACKAVSSSLTSLTAQDKIFEPENHVNNNGFDDESAQVTDAGLTEEEVLLENAVGESAEEVQRSTLLLRMKEGITSLDGILKMIQNGNGIIVHLESRPSKQTGVQFDVLVKVDMSRYDLLNLIKALRKNVALTDVTVLTENSINLKDPWFPRHAKDLDNCNHLMTKYEPELDLNHPGFSDKVYRARRKEIAKIAFNYKYGEPIPRIEYSTDEIETWRAVFNTVLELLPKHACLEYGTVFRLLQKEGIFTPNRIPQLEDISEFLKRYTGFTLRPAAGLLTARDFLASLAFRVFQSTQYVRHRNTPFHTPEPDCIHEMLGHMPLLADPGFAQFSQEIGLASLGASDEEIEKLSTVYWFTVEFGLCKEDGQIKAYGAGLLSSYGELLHAISDKPEHRPFDPLVTALQPYQDQEYQPIYYVAESFEDAKEKFRRWVSTMSRPFEVRYNPHTQRVEVLDSVEKLDNLLSQLNLEILHLNTAFNKLKIQTL